MATLRHADEGGGWRGARRRVACYGVLTHCEAVDVEFARGRPFARWLRRRGRRA